MRALKSLMRVTRLGKCANGWRAVFAFGTLPGCTDADAATLTAGLDACSNVEEAPDARMTVDKERIHFHVQLEKPMSIQTAPVSHVLYVDQDGHELTGWHGNGSPLQGADVLVALSPPDEDHPGALREGVAVYRLDAAGRRTPSGYADFDLLFTPTHAARDIEISMARSEDPGGNAPRGRLLVQNPGGDLVACTGALRAAPAIAEPSPVIDRIPPPEPGGLRIASYNVYVGTPVKNPEPFARTLRALSPDVVLLQEWTDASAEDIAAWFERYVPSASGWSAVAGAAWGVAVVSRYPLERLGPESIPPPIPTAGTNASENLLRLTGAIAQSPFGPIALASVHLKCCGGLGSTEDLRRIAEAGVVRDTLREALAGRSVALRIVGGDFNLAGARLPLDVIRLGLDADATELVPAETPVLGMGATYTWRNPLLDLLPERLDYVLVGDDALAIERGFTLDTARLAPPTLASAGLLHDDTAASDHLPIVVDVRPR